MKAESVNTEPQASASGICEIQSEGGLRNTKGCSIL